jgi:hypothetical protein
MLAGSQAAHAFAYRFAAPDGHERAHLLEESGHGYFAYAPLVAAIAVALCLVAFTLRVLAARRGRPGGALSLSAFALLPPLAFVFQEHAERLLHTGQIPVRAALEPTFRIGLLLQLPFALGAYLLARWLLGAADDLGSALATVTSSVFSTAPLLAVAPVEAALRRIPVLASGQAERGPPAVRLSPDY